jgi:hypothetical protein
VTNKTSIVEPDPLTLYPDTKHDRDITEDPMLEEFAVSPVGSLINAWPSLERLLSPSAPPATGRGPGGGGPLAGG